MTQRIEQFLEFVVRLPRLVRILIVAFFALMVVTAVFPLVDHLYIRFFFTAESVMAPSFITMAIGGLFYIWGWFVYVGTVGINPSAQKAILWYFVVGGVVTAIVLGLLIYGIFDLNIPVETA